MTKKLNNNLLFRLGLGGLFLTNSVAAWATPDEFKEIIENHTWVTNIASSDTLVSLIVVNDFLLFALFVLAAGKWRKLVALWATLWIVGVIYMTGIWTPEIILHTAVLSLIGYYYLDTKQTS